MGDLQGEVRLSQALRDVASAPGERILPGEWQKAVEMIKAGKDVINLTAGETDAGGLGHSLDREPEAGVGLPTRGIGRHGKRKLVGACGNLAEAEILPRIRPAAVAVEVKPAIQRPRDNEGRRGKTDHRPERGGLATVDRRQERDAILVVVGGGIVVVARGIRRAVSDSGEGPRVGPQTGNVCPATTCWPVASLEGSTCCLSPGH